MIDNQAVNSLGLIVRAKSRHMHGITNKKKLKKIKAHSCHLPDSTDYNNFVNKEGQQQMENTRKVMATCADYTLLCNSFPNCSVSTKLLSRPTELRQLPLLRSSATTTQVSFGHMLRFVHGRTWNAHVDWQCLKGSVWRDFPWSSLTRWNELCIAPEWK